MNKGDYVRTKKGTIYQFNSTSSKALSGAKKYMVKSSPNIIDLIEFGDYVNGHKVIDFMLENGKIKGIIVDADIWRFDENEIKSIVTKEMYASVEYRVETN